MKIFTRQFQALLFTVLVFSFNSAVAQVKADDPIYAKMADMDRLLFSEGFNNCNYTVLERILAADLEFYHDKGGMQDKVQFIEATKKNICNSPEGKITRKLVQGSMEVYAMEKNGLLYGAFVTGSHDFYLAPTGKAAKKTGTAKFTCLWLLNEKKEWILKRVVSYDHKASN